MNEPVYIMPAEYFGEAQVVDGLLDIGGLKVPFQGGYGSVYVRRKSDDLSVAEIHLARHDGFAQEELDHQNLEAERYPLGPKEYWRGEMVGKYHYGSDRHIMTNEEFEDSWGGPPD